MVEETHGDFSSERTGEEVVDFSEEKKESELQSLGEEETDFKK